MAKAVIAIADIGITEIGITAIGVAIVTGPMITKSGPNMNEKLEIELDRGASAGAEARGLLADRFEQSIPTETMEELKLVVSELVNNAYLHGEGAITLNVGLAADQIRVEVIDEGSGQAPAIRDEPRPGSGGLGLRIVDRLSSRWGAHEGTTHVWAEIPVR
jgi:anti-sigma regulatory factor (Ser/Thr protein kinase)